MAVYDQYYLVCGKIVFMHPEQQPQVLSLNGYIQHDKTTLSKKALRTACNSLLHTFSQRVEAEDPESKVQVLEVLLDNIIYLGQMTDEEFNDVKVEDDITE